MDFGSGASIRELTRR